MTRKKPDLPLAERDTRATAERPAPAGNRDPLIRWLVLVMLLAAVVFAATALSLVIFAKSLGDAPRTSVERQLATDEVAAREHPEVVENWARLALSYAEAERWDDAMDALAQGRAVRKAAILDLTEADILRMKGDRGAVAAYDRAAVSARAEHEQAVQRLLEEKSVDKPPPDVLLIQVLSGRALALQQDGKFAQAAEQASEALVMNPGDAQLRVAYGDILHELKQDAEAEAQYRSALQYVPGLPSAIDGLKRLGKEQ